MLTTLRGFGTLNENVLRCPDEGSPVAPLVLLRDGPDHLGAASLLRTRNVVGHARSSCPGAQAVWEGVDVTEADLPRHGHGVCEILIGLAGKACNDVRREVEVRTVPPYAGHDIPKPAGIVLTAHLQENPIAPALKAEMKVRAHLRVLHDREEAVVN